MSFKLARAQSRSEPRTREKALADGSAFLQGALLVVNGSNQYAECGADPASVAAVALSGAGVDVSIGNHLGRTEFPAGFMQGVAVQEEVEFRARYIGSLPANPGSNYGVVKDSDNLWKVDFTETGSVVVKYQRPFESEMPLGVDKEVIVTFLDTVVQVI